jgi:hypothetical protein
MEYSYGRILNHECGEHSIQHGFIFGSERNNYEWNINSFRKSSRPEIKTPKKYFSHDFKNLKEDDLRKEEKNHYQWNCEKPIGLNNLPLSEKYINSCLAYE